MLISRLGLALGTLSLVTCFMMGCGESGNDGASLLCGKLDECYQLGNRSAVGDCVALADDSIADQRWSASALNGCVACLNRNTCGELNAGHCDTACAEFFSDLNFGIDG